MGQPYATSPPSIDRIPGGIPYIIGNEAAERFSFYGMKAILVIFMTTYLLDAQGSLDPMTEEQAKEAFHRFTAWAYFFPFLGALIADALFGKYRTIMALSIVYCLGHLVLALDDTRSGLWWGLALIAIGAGGIKPCVSAHVGDQFGTRNQHLMSSVFAWFYFSINLGAFASTLLTPWLLQRFGPSVAFGVPGVLMLLVTLVFWSGRHRFVHIPAGGWGFLRESFTRTGLRAIGKLSIIYLFVAVFWSLFDQTGSAWVLQARKMDRVFLGIEWLPSQVQAVNPVLILMFIPLFSQVVYPVLGKWFRVTPLRKIAIGLFLAAFSFAISIGIEARIEAGGQPNIIWQLAAYAVLTAAEVMVSITCLEFSYTQAPARMKSLIMSLYMMSVAAGNLFTSLVNRFIQNEDGTSKWSDTTYYTFFTLLMLTAAIAFLAVVRFYREKTYIQGAEE